MTPYILNPEATFSSFSLGSMDAGLWTVGSQTLMLAANLAYEGITVDLGIATNGTHVGNQVFDGGANASGTQINFQSTGTGAFFLNTAALLLPPYY